MFYILYFFPNFHRTHVKTAPKSINLVLCYNVYHCILQYVRKSFKNMSISKYCENILQTNIFLLYHVSTKYDKSWQKELQYKTCQFNRLNISFLLSVYCYLYNMDYYCTPYNETCSLKKPFLN